MINPLIWFFILLFWTLLIRNNKTKKKLLLTTVVLIYFFSNSFIIAEFYRIWEVQPVEINKTIAPYDVGVVLGGGMVTYDKRIDRLTFRNNPDRIMQAVYLYNNNIINKILISGGSGSLIFRDMKESVLLKNYLINALNIPEKDVLIDSISDNTYQNALYSKAIIDMYFENPNVLLITSAVHMRRSQKCFLKQGLTVDVYPTNLIAGPRRFHFGHLFIPNLNSLSMWHALIHELIGISIYKVMGYT